MYAAHRRNYAAHSDAARDVCQGTPRYRSVLQYVSGCCSVLQCFWSHSPLEYHTHTLTPHSSIHQCIYLQIITYTREYTYRSIHIYSPFSFEIMHVRIYLSMHISINLSIHSFMNKYIPACLQPTLQPLQSFHRVTPWLRVGEMLMGMKNM